MAPGVFFWLLISQQEHQHFKDIVSPGFVKGPCPGLASWWHPHWSLSSHRSLSSPLIPLHPPFSRCSCINTCQILAIIALWGPFRIWSGQVYNLNLMGFEFSSCELKPFGDYSCPNAASCPHWKKKIVSKDIWTWSSYCKRTYCWWLECKETRTIWITFAFKWAWSLKWREWMNYLVISSWEVVNIKVFEQ